MPHRLHDIATGINMTPSNCSLLGPTWTSRAFSSATCPGLPTVDVCQWLLPSSRGGWILWRPVLHFELRGGTSYARWRYSSQPMRWCSDPRPSYTLPLSVAIKKLSPLDLFGNPSHNAQEQHLLPFYFWPDIFSAIIWLASTLIIPVLKSCPPQSSHTVCEWILSKDLCIKRTLCSASHW